MCRDTFPLSGHLYVFFSRRCDRVRIVYWDRNGIGMWTKRLERGRFRPALATEGALSASAVEFAELALVLEGSSWPERAAARAGNRR